MDSTKKMKRILMKNTIRMSEFIEDMYKKINRESLMNDVSFSYIPNLYFIRDGGIILILRK